MKTARDLLVSAIEEQRPLVLILGQSAWNEPENEDPVLLKALEKLGRRSEARRGWPAVLGTAPLPEAFYEWLSERFDRHVHPAWLAVLGEVPWSAVFTSSLDHTLQKLLSRPRREPELVLTASETPRATRSKVRPPLYYLFAHARVFDPHAIPPMNRDELNTRRSGHALPMLNKVMDTATHLGLIVVDGFVPGLDWIKLDAILGATGSAVSQQILWCGGYPQLSDDDAADFDAAVKSGRIVIEGQRLGTLVAELRALGQLPELVDFGSEETGIVSFKNGNCFETTPEERLRVEAVASIVDDSWTRFLPSLGEDAKYATFRRFHGDLGGGRLLVEGVRRGFAIERSFEHELLRQVKKALANHSSIDAPIMLHGQSGTGKSVALARIVAKIRKDQEVAVLYSSGRVPQPHDVSDFCKAAEDAGAKATLIVCDVNRSVDSCWELLMGLRSQGRRVVVLGSSYRIVDNDNRSPLNIEAVVELSAEECQKLSGLLKHFLPEQPDLNEKLDVNILAFLYRFLPASRPRIGTGLGVEVGVTEEILRQRGRRSSSVIVETELARKLIEAGFSDGYTPVFDQRQSDVLEAGDAAGRAIDLVMVSGSLNCPVPVNLLFRAVTRTQPKIDIALISEMFSELDLFRWEWSDDEHNELLVTPRLKLEAELICRRRLGSAEKEAERLIDMILSVRTTGVEQEHERQFLLNLLQQISENGSRGDRYQHSYVDIGRALTELRHNFGIVHPSLMLQESAFRRTAVRKNLVEDDQRVPLLEEARDAVQSALDSIEDRNLTNAKRTRQNLLVERASIYGFLAFDRAKVKADTGEMWSSYQAARTAIRYAVGVTNAYYPYDVGLWTPADLLRIANLTVEQQAELAADIYATLAQVDRGHLPPNQRNKFDERRMRVGEQLQNHPLTEEAYIALETNGSMAGYYLKARALAPAWDQDSSVIENAEDLSRAMRAADFLQERFNKIQRDERCLALLLECRWIAVMGRRPLRGERQPLPSDENIQREMLRLVRVLNQACGDAARHMTRCLEAALSWVTGDTQSAANIFRELSQITEYEDPGRVIKRHVITGADLKPIAFQGRIEKERNKGQWKVRVEGINQTVDLFSSNFPHADVAYGRLIKGFSIAFNYIGPIADPIR